MLLMITNTRMMLIELSRAVRLLCSAIAFSTEGAVQVCSRTAWL